MKTGTVKFFNESKGYGFITAEENNEDIFVHITGLNGTTIKEHDRVTFDIQQGKKGLNATNVALVD